VTERRPRRIVRRAVMALAVVMLLAWGYFGVWLASSFAWGAGLMPSWTDAPSRVVFAPFAVYITEGYPGAQRLNAIGAWAVQHGDRWRRGE
jgi:hypothetical protein